MLKEYILSNGYNVVIAAILTVITIVMLYYIIRSLTASNKAVSGQEKAGEEGQKKKDKDWGCELNNIMGYDFIQIQHPGADTKKEEKKEEEKNEDKGAAAEAVRTITGSRMGTTGRTRVEDDMPPEEPKARREVPTGNTIKDRPAVTEPAPVTVKDNDDEGENNKVSEDVSYSMSFIQSEEFDAFYEEFDLGLQDRLMERFSNDVVPSGEDVKAIEEVREIPDVVHDSSFDDIMEEQERMMMHMLDNDPEEERRLQEMNEELEALAKKKNNKD